MASPTNTFKNNLFGQLKTYSDAVQGVFEQRIARPLLALKRDLSRSSSTNRTSSVLPSEQSTYISYEESLLATTPLEVIDIETNDSLKIVLDKFKNAFSPITKRRISEDISIDNIKKPIRESRHSSISSPSNRNYRKNQLRNKSVSFAENTESEKIFSTLIVEQNELIHTHTDDNINDITIHTSSNYDEVDFGHDFNKIIRSRRLSIGNGTDLVYQDLSAEIVAYVLKHALRAIEKEDEELSLAKNQKNEEIIDLK